MSAAVTVSMVTWNSAKVIRDCLLSLAAQTFQDFSVTVVDNGSIDHTVTVVRETFPPASLIQKRRNMGFGAAHNQALRISRSPLVLCVNPDTILEPSALALLVETMQRQARAGAVGPKLRRSRRGASEFDLVERLTALDSTGIVRDRSGAVRDRGAGEEDTGQYDRAEPMFALSAACCLYRRAALEDIRFRDEFFDADFFMYKEDVDLSWRFRHRGWTCWYEPRAVVFHARSGLPPAARNSPRAQRQLRLARPLHLRQRSYRNHFLVAYKNQPFGDLLRRLPWTIPYEVGKFFFLLGTEPRTLAGLGQAVAALPRLWPKRQHILRQRQTA